MSAAKLAGRAVLVSALTVALVPVLGADPAAACSCKQGTDHEHFKSADVVFKGTLRKTTPPSEAERQRYGSGAPEIFEFLPNRVYKGKVTHPQRVSTAEDGATCGLEIQGKGPFLVFAYRDKLTPEEGSARGPNAPDLRASLCGGTREVGANEKLPFGNGKAVKPTKQAQPAATPKPTNIPRALEPTAARSQSAVPADVALPLVAGMLALAIGATAWATRPGANRGMRL